MIRHLRSKLRIVIATALVATILATTFFWQKEGETIQKPTTAATEQIDFFVTDGTLRRWDETGSLVSVTNTPYAEHLPNSKVMLIDTPYSVGFTSKGSVDHTLSAKKGTLLDDNSRFDLAGEVELHHNPETESDTALFTEALSYFPDTGIATSDVAVEFLNQQGTTTGVGMKLDTEQQKLDILTKVRGTYVPATTN